MLESTQQHLPAGRPYKLTSSHRGRKGGGSKNDKDVTIGVSYVRPEERHTPKVHVEPDGEKRKKKSRDEAAPSPRVVVREVLQTYTPASNGGAPLHVLEKVVYLDIDESVPLAHYLVRRVQPRRDGEAAPYNPERTKEVVIRLLEVLNDRLTALIKYGAKERGEVFDLVVRGRRREGICRVLRQGRDLRVLRLQVKDRVRRKHLTNRPRGLRQHNKRHDRRQHPRCR